MVTVNEIAQLKAVLCDVREQCRVCRETRECTIGCPLHKWTTFPVQIDLGDGLRREQWIADAYDIACGLGAGWWSTIRREVESQLGAPWHPSWWGGVASAMYKDGWRREILGRTCEVLKQRNKAREYFWRPATRQTQYTGTGS